MIPPETDFVEVARQILITHIMKNPQFGALQVRIKGLCRVIVSFSTSIFFLAMVHPIVGGKHLAGLSIAVKLIGHICTIHFVRFCQIKRRILNNSSGGNTGHGATGQIRKTDGRPIHLQTVS